MGGEDKRGEGKEKLKTKCLLSIESRTLESWAKL